MSDHPIDYSKLRKDPASTGYVFRYQPIAVAAEDIAKAQADISGLVRAKHEAAIAQLLDLLAPPEPMFAGVDRAAPVKPLPRLTREGQAKLDELRKQYAPKPTDPLDVEYDGVRLRELLEAYQLLQREHHLVHYSNGKIVRYGESMPGWFKNQQGGFTAAQRAAVSAHWSAELRAKIAASTERDRNVVFVDPQDEP